MRDASESGSEDFKKDTSVGNESELARAGEGVKGKSRVEEIKASVGLFFFLFFFLFSFFLFVFLVIVYAGDGGEGQGRERKGKEKKE